MSVIFREYKDKGNELEKKKRNNAVCNFVIHIFNRRGDA